MPGQRYNRGRIMHASLLGVGVGKHSHIAGREPQLVDDISVADDHHQARR